jgi:hypothetical protein
VNRVPNGSDWVAGGIKERVVFEPEPSRPDDEGLLSVRFQEQAPVLLNQDALHDRVRSVSSGVPRAGRKVRLPPVGRYTLS